MTRETAPEDRQLLRDVRLRALAEAPPVGDGRFDGMVSGFAHGDTPLVALWVAPGRRGTRVAADRVESVVNRPPRGGSRRAVLTVERGSGRARSANLVRAA